MKIKKIVIALLVITISACGGRNESSDQQQESMPQSNFEQAVPESKTAESHPGFKVYTSVCLTCHMAKGTGVPGMFPPLAKSDWVTGDKERLIRITIQGLSGKIEVNGATYNNIMPSNAQLSDRQIADVLTYIRQSFGNDASEITLEEVQKVRNNL